MNFCKSALNSHIPFIVDLNGPAMAGGAIVASLSDFALARKGHAKLSFSEVKVGIPIPHCLFKIAERRMGTQYFSDMMLLGKNYGCKDLLDMNFATVIYEESRDESLNNLIRHIYTK